MVEADTVAQTVNLAGVIPDVGFAQIFDGVANPTRAQSDKAQLFGNGENAKGIGGTGSAALYNSTTDAEIDSGASGDGSGPDG